MLLLVPVVDRSPLRRLRSRRIVAILAAIVLIALIALSLYVYFSPVAQHME